MINTLRRLVPLLPLLLLGACARPERAPEVEVSAQPAHKSAPAVRPPVIAAPTTSKPRKPGPIATRPLNVKTECQFRDETGYNGTMKLDVEAAKVQSFAATVNVPRRGVCSFDLKNFRQTRELPNVELSHYRDHCIVRVWEQDERVTVAFQQCQKMCSGNAWEGLWPILTDTRDGSCA
jgi:hypothetical protein